MLKPLNHGITLDSVYDLIDAYMNDGHQLFDIIPIFVEVLKKAGFINLPADNEAVEEKN